jgi:ribosomal protein S18 acetylase RimI-like enzyme
MIMLREFAINDYDAIYRLWQSAGPGLGMGRSDTRSEIVKKLERDPDLFLVAEDDGRIIGTVIGGYDGRRGIIYHLAVEKSHQRHGIGKMLMHEIERRLAAKGCLRSYLLVKPEAIDVLSFYQESGWEIMPVHILGKNIS